MKTETIKPLKSRLTNLAFTLAETLIVIGIIGVVAALTLPNLNHATGDKETVTKVKKIYSSYVDAFDRAQAIYGPVDEWFTNDTDESEIVAKFASRISEFMKVSKSCGNAAGCYDDSRAKFLDGSSASSFAICNTYTNRQTFVLADGLSFCVIKDRAESRILLYTDIDGVKKGKSQWGYDLFNFMVYIDGSKSGDLKPCGLHLDDFSEEYVKSECFTKGLVCTSWVTQFGNMDYTKIKDGKCPDGKELNFNHNSCN